MRLNKKIFYSIPLLLFLLIAYSLFRGLNLNPEQIPSPLINKKSPVFKLPNLLNPSNPTTQRDFLGRVTLVNVWATWCEACAEEHNTLLNIAKESSVQMYGIDYKDENTEARKWLRERGNPFHIIAIDQEGLTSIDWGVYGTPETFIVDKKGLIRYKIIGPLTFETWRDTIKPLIMKLQDEKE